MIHRSERISQVKGLGLFAGLLLAGTGQLASAQHGGDRDANSPSGVLTLFEAFRIGDETAGDSVLLGYIFDMAVDSRGRLYLTDSGLKGIRTFSSAGVFIGEIGNEGKGPGEFAETPFVHVGHGDSLYAWDRTTARLSIYSPQGKTFVKSVSVRGGKDRALRPEAFVGATERGLLVKYASFYTPGSKEFNSMRNLLKFVRWDGTAGTDTLAQLPVADYVVFNLGDMSGIRYLPYAAHPHFALGADQVVYYGMGDAINITALPLNGAAPRNITLSHVPISVTRAERNAAVANVPLEDLRKDLFANIPANKPAFNSLFPDDAGNLWIRLSRSQSDQTITWLVLDYAGLVVARAVVPKNVRLLAARHGRAYGAMTIEETGIPVAVAWDIGW